MHKTILILIAVLLSLASCSGDGARTQGAQVRAIFMTSQDGTKDLIYYYSSVQGPLKIADDIVVYTVGMRNAVEKSGKAGVFSILGSFKEKVEEFIVELASAQ